jgi:dephospho-CoA kinase
MAKSVLPSPATPLPHKVFILTGGIGVGKSTVKKVVQSVLNDNFEVREIYSKNDLYVTFLQEIGKVNSQRNPETIEREEMTGYMHQLYQEYGQELGTDLLYKFLQDKPEEVVYIVDSKRNPKGIQRLQELFQNAIVCGVHTDFEERVKRIVNRKKNENETNQKKVIQSLLHEEEVFQVSQAVKRADIIINNTHNLQYVNELQLFKLFQKKGWITEQKVDNPLPPHEGRLENNDPTTIGSKEIQFFLQKVKDFEEKENPTIFVCQGGNRYISAYLQRKGIKTFDAKLTSLTKKTIGLILSSLLTESEAVESLEFEDFQHLLKYDKEGKIPKHGMVLTRSELLQCIDRKVQTPFFKQLHSDNERREEFKYLLETLDSPAALPEYWVEMVRIIFKHTQLINHLNSGNEKYIWIDDIFYRGRTTYTIRIIGEIFNTWQNSQCMFISSTWKSQDILKKVEDKLDISYINKKYPFENTFQTEKGVWQLEGGRYILYDYELLRAFLKWKGYSEHSEKEEQVQVRVTELSKKIGVDLDYQFKEACIFIKLEFDTLQIPVQTEMLNDQRLDNTGFVPSFGLFLQNFVDQSFDVAHRKVFYHKMVEIFEQIDNESKTHEWKTLQEIYNRGKKHIHYKQLNRVFYES